MKTIAILGATGSVGTQTAKLIEKFPDSFKVKVLVAGSKAQALGELALALRPEFVALYDEKGYAVLKEMLEPHNIAFGVGAEAVLAASAIKVDLSVAAITGAAGLLPSYTALSAGNQLALANKEALVCAGTILTKLAADKALPLLPMDSEHNALFQLLEGKAIATVNKLILTASGGPFRSYSLAQMQKVTLSQALKHPNWSMGEKITIDSATMMNKGLELIEAYYLFGLAQEKIDILVHKQSAVHGLVEMCDGTLLAALGVTDMAGPIAHCLAWPNRLNGACASLDLSLLKQLDFEAPDPIRFPALRLARDSLKAGAWAPIVLNAANEIAVANFLKGNIKFLEIASFCEDILNLFGNRSVAKLDSISSILALDQEVRVLAAEKMNG